MSLLPLTFIFPLIGFLILAFMRDRLTEQAASFVGVGSMGLAALCALVTSVSYLTSHDPSTVVNLPLWTWLQVGDFAPRFGLDFDGLALTMTGVITGVGFLIHLFASWYMKGDSGFARFFSYMNLFVASMLLLVLADNLLLLYLGHSPSSLKGHREEERCLRTGGRPISLQSSKRAGRSTQGSTDQLVSPPALGR